MAAKVSLFIIGAPKCGTTALAQYLSEHAQVVMSNPKEPNFFCNDLSRSIRNFTSLDEYESKAFPQETAKTNPLLGEASVWYWISESAIPNILSYNPKARFIAMLRNPIEMLPSLYDQLRWSGDEDAGTFEDAWRLQEDRLSGKVQTVAREPKILQYRKIGLLGQRLKEIQTQIESDKLLTLLFDDFANDTLASYKRVLEFLDLEYDNRVDFPIVNEAKRHRFHWLGQQLMHPPEWSQSLASRVKRTFGINKLNWLPRLRSINKVDEKVSSSLELVPSLLQTFSTDVETLEELLDQDLARWKIEQTHVRST